MVQLNNPARLQRFKDYLNNAPKSISYSTYRMHREVCNKLLEDFLTTRQSDLLNDLKDHIMLFGTIYTGMKNNKSTSEDLEEVKNKYTYFKMWIKDQS